MSKKTDWGYPALTATFLDGPAAIADGEPPVMAIVVPCNYPMWPDSAPLIWLDPESGKVTHYTYRHVGHGQYRVAKAIELGDSG